MTVDRRTFLSTSAGVGASLLSRGVGANDTVNVAVMGVNGRGAVLAKAFAAQTGANVTHICDVDSMVADKVAAEVVGSKAITDFRRTLESSDVDALAIAAPDHWHAPAAILALQAGKHVYLEKPCSHNPREGEILVEAARKYGVIVQMGNQRRSWPNVMHLPGRYTAPREHRSCRACASIN